jgi:hypothetical protein
MPSSSPLAASIVFGFGVLALGACGSSWDPDHQARDQATTALDCSEVSLVKIADNRYRAEGCGGVVEVLCSAGHNEPVCLVGRARSEEHVSGIADLGSGSEDPDVDPDPGGEDEGPIAPSSIDEETAAIETTIRGGLDAHRDDVLACTNRSASVVRVRYAFDGSVTITLGGDLEGSPEEGCVRAALGGVRVSGGHEGTVMHLVRRGASAP